MITMRATWRLEVLPISRKLEAYRHSRMVLTFWLPASLPSSSN